ncbi:HAMP domain-containing histidine kinase [Mobilitalea sibirica]|uniref:histidine kinase n=2 Tax=Mobilitalea sibirica TaxID=1462919 RepID=A0A8J7KSI7_9FIRM|nr:HAMP domain-containing histidine kinase [Mobilitalea sibirica]
MLTLAIINIGIYLVFQEGSWNLSGPPAVLVSVLTIAVGIILFITYFLILTQKFVNYIKVIANGINEISLGNLDNRIVIKNEDEFALIADKLNQMADDIKKIMENERRSEYAKNELITSVAHDLRTPLTSIIGYLDLVSSKKLSIQTQKNYVEIAYNKSKRLEKLIEDLFTYTKFNFGEVKANYTEVDMVKLIDQLLDEFYPSFKENELEYEFKTIQNSLVIHADGDLLARAFANLISNAIKYGRDGKNILLNLSKEEEGVTVTITNYGEIIPVKDLEQIFQRFYRVESSRSSETGGSGLGLAIARSIIKMHGGDIKAESGSKGTVFTVRLNYEPKTN